MPLAGPSIITRALVDLIAVHWPNKKVEATATFWGEAKGSLGAYHVNTRLIGDTAAGQKVRNVETGELVTVLDPAAGRIRLSDGSTVTVPPSSVWVTSQDCGVTQNNITAEQIGTDAEWTLRTLSTVPAEYMAVARHCVQVAYWKYEEPWVRDGKPTIRQWGPWEAFDSGWALYPEFFVIHRDPLTHEPATPFTWVPTGRFLHIAIRGVANWHLLVAKDLDEKEALAEAERLASVYGVTKGELYWNAKSGIVDWRYPPKPDFLPASLEEARSYYPVRNDGRSPTGPR